jgi:hypothetical protein
MVGVRIGHGTRLAGRRHGVAVPLRHQSDDDEETSVEENQGVLWLTPEEGHALFDRRARKHLGISGEEFLRRWDAGEIGPVPDTPEWRGLGELVMMMPLARRTKS